MFKQSKELREERARIHEEMKALLLTAEEEKRDLTDEESQKFDGMDADINRLTGRITRLERAYDLEQEWRSRAAETGERLGREDTPKRSPDEKEDRSEQYHEVWNRYMKFGLRGLNEEQRSLMFEFQKEIDPEIRAQSAGTDSEGGFTVPEGFVRNLEKALLDFGGMREASRILSTASGNPLPWPEVDDTSNTGELLGENVTATEQDFVFAATTFNAWIYSSKLVRVSVSLLQDSAFDLNVELPIMLGERIGRITNTHFTTGDGSSKPNGVVTAATLGFTGASNAAITYSELVETQHSVDPAYRRRGALWMFNDSTLKAIKQLVDGQSRPLWAPGIAVREPDTILGDRFVINQDVASIATVAKSVLYGDFSKYIIRDVQGVTVLRLVERYAEFNQVAFLSFTRHDGDLVDAGTNPIKFLQQPV